MSPKSHLGWKRAFLQGVLAFALPQACAPRPVYRSVPRQVVELPRKVGHTPVISSRPPPPAKPIFRDTVREEDLPVSRANPRSGTGLSPTSMVPEASTTAPVKPPTERTGKEQIKARTPDETPIIFVGKEQEGGENVQPTPEPLSPRPDQISLLSMITSQISPQRAASLRLTEEGRELLKNDEHDRGLSRLEKALAIDSTNPYAYYYLAHAHHLLTHYTESLNFLEAIEGRFAQEPSWQARVLVLKGENFWALGLLDQADKNYARALKLDPTHPVALERMIHISGESPATLP